MRVADSKLIVKIENENNKQVIWEYQSTYANRKKICENIRNLYLNE